MVSPDYDDDPYSPRFRLDYVARIRTPFCVLGLREQKRRIIALDYLPLTSPELAPRTPLAVEAARQLLAYLEDPRFKFDFAVSANGTDFETRVWHAIGGIPAGSVRTYGDIARAVRSIPRAVGGACGRNPLPLVIPCHRVIAAGGGLGGFMGGRDDLPLAIKRWLLRHEGVLQ